MAEDNIKPKKTVSNVIYSILVFFGTSCIGIAVLDPAALNNDEPQVTAKAMLATGIGIILSIVFSMWYKKR